MIKLEHIKEKAIELRNKRYSLDDIANMLNQSRTTVYYWIKDIDVKPDKKPQSAAQMKGSEAITLKYKKLRDEAYTIGLELYEEYKDDNLFRDFILIYLTEGFRKTRHVVSVANSNVNILKVTKHIFELFCDKNIGYKIQYHADQDVAALYQYWSEQLNIPEAEIKFLRKSNSGQMAGRNWNSKYGVLTLTVNDTYFRSKVQAWMDSVEADWLKALDT